MINHTVLTMIQYGSQKVEFVKMSAGEDLLSQEREVEELLARVPAETIGARLCRARQRQGLSVRELALRANVNKNSVVRLENGGVSQPLTVVKICAALGLHVATIAEPEDGADVLSIHRHKDDRWYDLTDFGAGPLANRPLSDSERAKLAGDGIVPLLMHKSRLGSGNLLTRVIELYEPSPTRSHLGEEVVYVLSGTARITVGAKSFDLEEGESVVFWSSEQHSYAPAKGSQLPVRVLSVSVHLTAAKMSGRESQP